MYQLNNRLLAPYELNPPIQPQSFARGGHTKKQHPRMVVAHFNPHELNVLDHLQGKDERCPRSGIRTYTHLEELLKNPHIVNSVHHHARRHRAEGGSMAHLAEGGRHGDTELAMIGPHTHHLFNQLAGHPTHNPHTGYPEYFSISDALGGLWNGIKGAAGHVWNGIKGIGQAAAPALGGIAQNYLKGKFGGVGDVVGGMLPGIGQSIANSGEQNPTYQAIGQGLGRGAQAYQAGASGREALGHGMNYTGHQLGGMAGGALQGAAGPVANNQGLGSVLSGGLSGGLSKFQLPWQQQ